ncbi:MAG: TonB family protein [Sphingomonas sp.]|uniref:energy transducer TonB n=1 Tax=Sphingomonas sp. TaxID=28214 RepID=UPI001229B615|nr:energy transducer TonB [Sphingomonas sp.]THD36735.1 MAG: TonB family protein [Sphingomonas sp.]
MIRQSMVIGAVALLALPSAATGKNKSAPATSATSLATWFPQSSYPAEAKRAHQQGRVVVELTIDTSGIPTACKVVTSSNVASLDAVTCQLAIANGRFSPAKGADGRPIEGTYVTPGVRWALFDPPPIKLAGPWRVAATVAIDATGKIVSCKDERKGPVPQKMMPCVQAASIPPVFGRYARDYSTDAKPLDMVIETLFAFDGGATLPTLYDSGGRETLMMTQIHFDVGVDGKVQNCQVIAQSGPGSLNLCDDPGSYLPLDKRQGVTVVMAMSRPAG